MLFDTFIPSERKYAERFHRVIETETGDTQRILLIKKLQFKGNLLNFTDWQVSAMRAICGQYWPEIEPKVYCVDMYEFDSSS